MKSQLFYFISFILFTFSCTKKKVEPKLEPEPIVNLGIQYISSTYSNVALRYRLADVYTPYSICIGNTIKLTYVAGDSIHLELTSKIGFSQKSVTLPFYAKYQSGWDMVYCFRTPEPHTLPDSYFVSYFIYIHQDINNGKISCSLNYNRAYYDGNKVEEIDTDSSIVAD